jgi:diguanylate cyclase (GGDEF)-like protein
MKKFINQILLLTPNFSKEEQEIKYKVAFLNNVFFFASIVAFGMGFIRWQENHLIGMIDFGFSGLSLALLYYLRRNKDKIELLSTLALMLSFILFLAIFILATYNTTRTSLFFLLSASAFFLKGRKVGFLWLIFILLSIISSHLLFHSNMVYSRIDILTLGLYLIALYFILDNYETIKEEQKQQLEKLNAYLEEEINQRTMELQKTNEELMIEKQSLKALSSTDQLTGLCNRYKLEELFEFERSQSLRYKTDLSIMLIDIDHFKSINDNYGHNAGDIVLKELALTLKKSIRNSDVAVRWGGEEFIVITPKTTLEQAQQLAETIRYIMKSTSYSEIGHLTASIGVASFEENDSLKSLVQRADSALYRAKKLGRDNVQIEFLNSRIQFDLDL